MFAFFDLGGVVFNWEHGLDRLSLVSGKSPEEVRKVFSKHDDDACRGKITARKLGEIYERELGFSFDSTDFIDFWTSSFSPITETHKLLNELIQLDISIGLLTNIYKGTYEKALGKFIPDLPYKTVIKSCDFGCVKPEREFFRIAQESAGYEGKDIILIDDYKSNIDKAVEFGWKGVLYEGESVENLRKALSGLLNINIGNRPI